jgi:hypothetical protein
MILRSDRRRVTWAIAIWVILAVAVWNGVFDMLVVRGEHEYLLAQARHELGTGPRRTIDEVMTGAIRRARLVASLWSAVVLAAGAGTAWLLGRRG